ncbi:MAG: YifB family Mg chelatase-like AAA ATPase [Spirochaetia bacterium]
MIFSYAPLGYEGEVVSVEADLRRSIPGFDVVGLPDSAVREARERVRVAVRNSGFVFPAARILVNLSPADVRKEGSGFDLPIALAVIRAGGSIPLPFEEPPGEIGRQPAAIPDRSILAVGELTLSGRVEPVKGVISAVCAGFDRGIDRFILPADNCREAAAAVDGKGYIVPVRDLAGAVRAVSELISSPKPRLEEYVLEGVRPWREKTPDLDIRDGYGDLSDIRGQDRVKRALQIAATGRHNLLLFDPPGSGKTMAATRLPGILPDLSSAEALEVTRIYSLAGQPIPSSGLISRPPFRFPHHSASQEGMIGGGRGLSPGEISLAHKGVLFLDEVPEFRKSILQALREPTEQGRVFIVRAGKNYWFPADFQLIFTANPCPCGNLGAEKKPCLCSRREIEDYWKRLGAAVMDRIDMRIPLKPIDPREVLQVSPVTTRGVRQSVEEAVERQRSRYGEYSFDRNGRIPPGLVDKFCVLDEDSSLLFTRTTRKLSLSTRACHGILKVARTIADLDGGGEIGKSHLLEATEYRRYGDSDFFWG